MKVATYEAVVENGRIKFAEEPHLPERAKVYVVVAESDGLQMKSPRLARSEQAADLVKEVVEEPSDASI